ncbi:uncharacterized protein LOC141915493 isoform X2 [Tubulanus polymorphus]|uniref:uncharacterized protein LOC141915493 isoform X2 n=1 Tax=Tubulanus polymorphus TaxID=672921 RepID=UPI003DA3928E
MDPKIGFWTPIYLFICLFINRSVEISDLRRCGNKQCTAVISLGRAVMDLDSPDPDMLNFIQGNVVRIYSKHAGSERHFWGGEVNNKHGYFPKTFVKEFKVFISHPQHVVPTGINDANVDADPTEVQEEPKAVYLETDETEIKPGSTGIINMDQTVKKDSDKEEATNKQPAKSAKAEEPPVAPSAHVKVQASSPDKTATSSNTEVDPTEMGEDESKTPDPTEIKSGKDEVKTDSAAPNDVTKESQTEAKKVAEKVQDKKTEDEEKDPTELDPTEMPDSSEEAAPQKPEKEEKSQKLEEPKVKVETNEKLDGITKNIVDEPKVEVVKETKIPTDVDPTEQKEEKVVGKTAPIVEKKDVASKQEAANPDVNGEKKSVETSSPATAKTSTIDDSQKSTKSEQDKETKDKSNEEPKKTEVDPTETDDATSTEKAESVLPQQTTGTVDDMAKEASMPERSKIDPDPHQTDSPVKEASDGTEAVKPKGEWRLRKKVRVAPIEEKKEEKSDVKPVDDSEKSVVPDVKEAINNVTAEKPRDELHQNLPQQSTDEKKETNSEVKPSNDAHEEKSADPVGSDDEKETKPKGEWRLRKKVRQPDEEKSEVKHTVNLKEGVPDLSDEKMKEIARQKFLRRRQQSSEVINNLSTEPIDSSETKDEPEKSSNVELTSSQVQEITPTVAASESASPSSSAPVETSEHIKPTPTSASIISTAITDELSTTSVIKQTESATVEMIQSSLTPDIAEMSSESASIAESTPEVEISVVSSSVVVAPSSVESSLNIVEPSASVQAATSPDVSLFSSKVEQPPPTQTEGSVQNETTSVQTGMPGFGLDTNSPYHTADFVSRSLLQDGSKPVQPVTEQTEQKFNDGQTSSMVTDKQADVPSETPVKEPESQDITDEQKSEPNQATDVPTMSESEPAPSEGEKKSAVPTETPKDDVKVKISHPQPPKVTNDQPAATGSAGGNKVLALGVRLTDPVLQVIIDQIPDGFHHMLDNDMLGLPPKHTLFIYIVTSILVLLFTCCFFCSICGGNKSDKVLKKLESRVRALDEQIFVTSREKDNFEEQWKLSENKAKKAEDKLKSHEDSKTRLLLDLQNFKLHNSALQKQVSSLEKSNQEKTTQLELLCQESGGKEEQILSAQHQLLQVEETTASLQMQLSQMQVSLQDKTTLVESLEGQLEALNEELEVVNQSKQQLLQQNDGWEERVTDLEEQLSSQCSQQKELQEQVSFKENEIEVLRDCFLQLKAFESQSEDGEDGGEEGGEGDSGNPSVKEKLQAMMDVSRVNAILKSVEEDKTSLHQRLIIEQESRKELEDQIEKLKSEVQTLQEGHHQADKQSQESMTKLSVLSTYFKEKEMQLQRELGEQQALRKQTEGKASFSDSRCEELETEMSMYRQQIEDLQKEISNVERDFRMQISVQEKKAHENWLTAREAERKLKEAEQNNTLLRQKLSEVENRNHYDGVIRPLPTRPLPPPGMMNGPPPPLPLGDRPISRSSGMPPSPLMRDAEVVSPPFDRMPPPPLDRRPFLPPDRPLPPRGPPPPLDRRPYPHPDGRSPPLIDRRPSMDRRSPPPPLDRRPMSSIDRRSPPPPMDRRFSDRRSPPPYRHAPDPRMAPPGVSPVPYMPPQGPPPRGPPPHRRDLDRGPPFPGRPSPYHHPHYMQSPPQNNSNHSSNHSAENPSDV